MKRGGKDGGGDKLNFHLAAVAAYNVGDIFLSFEEKLKTNNYRQVAFAVTGDISSRCFFGQKFDKGDSLGGFRLGSTVVLVFECEKEFDFAQKEGESVRLGEALVTRGGVKKQVGVAAEGDAKANA